MERCIRLITTFRNEASRLDVSVEQLLASFVVDFNNLPLRCYGASRPRGHTFFNPGYCRKEINVSSAIGLPAKLERTAFHLV